MNGVAEALLQDLLSQATAQTQLLQRLARGLGAAPPGGGSGGGGGGGGAAAGAQGVLGGVLGILGGFGSAISKLVTGAFTLLGTAIGSTVGVFFKLYNAGINLAKAFADFGAKAATSGTRLSDVFNLFSNLPIVGPFASMLGVVQQVNEAYGDMYREVSQIGATFGGSMDMARMAATMAGMSIQEFTKAMRANVEGLSYYGGLTEKGAMAVARMNMQVYLAGDQLGRTLAGLGYTADQSAKAIADYMEREGKYGSLRTQTDEQVIKGSRDYAFNLEILARLSGVEREEAEKRRKEALNDRMFNAYLASMEEGQRKENIKAMVNATAILNPEALAQTKAGLMGLSIPMGDFGEMMVQTGQAHELYADNVTNIVNSARSIDEVFKGELNRQIRMGNQTNQFAAKNIQMLTAAGVKVSHTGMDLAMRLKDGSLSYEEAMKMITSAGVSGANALARNEQGARAFGAQLLDIAARIAGPFKGVILDAGMKLANIMSKYAPAISGFIAKMSEIALGKISEYLEILTNKNKGLPVLIDTLIKDMRTALSTIWKEIERPMTKFYESYLKPWFQELMVKFKYWMMDLMEGVLGEAFVAGDPESRKKDMEKELEFIRRETAATRRMYEEGYGLTRRGRSPGLQEATAERDAARADRREWVAGADDRKMDEYWDTMTDRFGAIGYLSKGAVALLEYGFGSRHSGTIGMTGNWWETESGLKNVQAGETVLTQGQLSQIVDTAGSNKLAQQVERLNSLTAQLVGYMKETADNTAKTHKAAASLGGNIYAS